MSQAQSIPSPGDHLLKYIPEHVAQYESNYNLSTGRAFLMWYGVEALELSEDSAYEAASYDGGNDMSIDFFYVDDENERVVIAQGKFNARGQFKPTSGEFLELVHTTDWLQNPESFEREGRPDLAEAARDYNEALGKGFTIDYHFVYMGVPHKEVIDASHNFNNANISTTPIRTSRVLHIDVLRQIHDEFIDASSRIEAATIALSTEQTFQQRGSYGKSLAATIPGTELQKLYKVHGDALFDRNVRVFLGTRAGSVNAGIRDTLASPDRRNFWAYNNGIMFICDRYEFEEDSGKLTIHNFSIVNGCQTTVSVAQSLDPAPPEVSILGRFIAATDDQVVDSIIRFTNSQTPIRNWDIISQDKNQKRWQAKFAEEPNPFFYELRRGETGHLSLEERRQFTRSGKFHVIKPDLLAQYLAAFKGLPVEAYRYKASLFTTHRETIFPSDLRIEEAIVAWLAGDAAEEAVKVAIADANQRDEPIRSLLLRRGAKLFTLAVMGTILAERNGATYLSRITRATAGSKANRQRLSSYAVLAVEWYAEIMKDLIDSGTDLNVLIRTQDTFAKIRAKVLTKWKVQVLSQAWVDDALPKL
ncbi:MAG: AIPR family protein [Chloroflexota bacterium]|nr:AIPR family protein [Chloroflexota bacterium]